MSDPADVHAIAWTAFDTAFSEFPALNPGKKAPLMRRQRYALDRAVTAVAAAIAPPPAPDGLVVNGLPDVLRRSLQRGQFRRDHGPAEGVSRP